MVQPHEPRLRALRRSVASASVHNTLATQVGLQLRGLFLDIAIAPRVEERKAFRVFVSVWAAVGRRKARLVSVVPELVEQTGNQSVAACMAGGSIVYRV